LLTHFGRYPVSAKIDAAGGVPITSDEIVRSAFEAFRADAETVPPLTLRGGNAVDSYDDAEPFDPACDDPTDAYIEAFAFWGLATSTHNRGGTISLDSSVTPSGVRTIRRWLWRR